MPWAMLFTDDVVLCNPSREMMEARREREFGKERALNQTNLGQTRSRQRSSWKGMVERSDWNDL